VRRPPIPINSVSARRRMDRRESQRLRIAETSELCDVSGMALLSRFPAHRGSTASRMLQSQSKERAMGELERNRQNVVAFYDLMFNQCRPSDAIARARTSTAP
jgi:hypothetical protein